MQNSLIQCSGCGKYFSSEETMINEKGDPVCHSCWEKEQAKLQKENDREQ